uniref:Uncharacterized protein n=1 Tax=Arundo donax TaxID=35708 RepID=A0A0A9GXV1_ARUDO
MFQRFCSVSLAIILQTIRGGFKYLLCSSIMVFMETEECIMLSGGELEE